MHRVHGAQGRDHRRGAAEPHGAAYAGSGCQGAGVRQGHRVRWQTTRARALPDASQVAAHPLRAQRHER